MELLYIVYCFLALAATAVIWADLARRRIADALDRRLNAPLYDRCLRMVVESDCTGDEVLPPLRSRRERMQLARVLSELADKTDVGQHACAERMVASYDLDRLLLDRARRSHGYRRAQWLLRLSRLNPRRTVAEQAARFLDSRNRYVRFHAMMCIVASDPLHAHRMVAAWDERLNSFEISQIIALVFRGRMPVACAPLLNSPHPNLRLLGIGIVRRIGAEETRPLLMKIAANDPDRAVAARAAYALCALHLPLDERAAIRALSRMSSADRKSLYRFMALEGYSVGALSALFREQERRYFETLVGSYKSTIA